jgi:hypothetical protein
VGNGSFVWCGCRQLGISVSLDLYLNLSFGISRCTGNWSRKLSLFGACRRVLFLNGYVQINRYYNLHRSSRNRIGGRSISPWIQSYVRAIFPKRGSKITQNTAIMASDQIRQMVNFILQEAHEKANEIRVKVSFLRHVCRTLG